MNHIGCMTRRDAVQRGLGVVATAVVFWGTSSKASAADNKLAKSIVQYTDAGTVKDMDCDDCIQFIPGKTPDLLGTCKVVEGEINPHGHCLAFSPKPRS